jgi:hypothetical protein
MTAFASWYALLNKIQSNEDLPIGGYYLRTEIYNSSEWQHNVEIVKRGGAQDSDLKVVWVGGQVYVEHIGSDTYLGTKSQGGLTVRGISSSVEPGQITNGDKSAGVTWDGQIVISYDVSWAENEFWPADNTPASSLSNLKTWIVAWEQDPYWESSAFAPVKYVVAVVLQGGQWMVRSAAFTEGRPQLGDPLSGVQKVFPWMGDPRVCQDPNVSSSCQLIRKTITY